jgi:ribose-phosphate pyrophosphokinase
MKPIVFALPGNEELAKNLAGLIHAETGETVIRHFPDGESYVRVVSDVTDRKVVLICTLSHPDEKLLPLYFLAKAIRSLGAKSIMLVAPYLSYMRQDKAFKPGEAITSVYFASLVSGFVDSLVTIDPHLHRRHSMAEIYEVPCTVLHASTLISDYIRGHVEKPLVIGPDAESEQWVSEVAKQAGAPFIILQKERSGDSDVRISVPDVERFMDHTPVLVDDIISTAGTMIGTVKHLKSAGMKAPVCIGVHAVFAGNAYEALKAAGVSRVVTCNTISHETNVIDVSSFISKAIQKS